MIVTQLNEQQKEALLKVDDWKVKHAIENCEIVSFEMCEDTFRYDEQTGELEQYISYEDAWKRLALPRHGSIVNCRLTYIDKGVRYVCVFKEPIDQQF